MYYLWMPLGFDPEWKGWESSFTYDCVILMPPAAINVQKFLEKEILVVECYASHSFREDSLIGRVKVDLLTVLAGPSAHYHTLLSVRALYLLE